MSHSKIVGGSTAERVINCPGSVALSATMPPQVENDAMREGTRLHELVAEVLNERIDSRSIDDEKVLAIWVGSMRFTCIAFISR